MAINHALLDQLPADYQKPEDILGQNGLLKQLTKAVLERSMQAEDEQLPTISKSWRLNWERLIPFMSYTPEIRRVIYTASVIESVNSSLRKVLKNRGSFPSEEAVIKLVYLALRNISARWSLPVRDWASAMNRFAIMFEGRMPLD